MQTLKKLAIAIIILLMTSITLITTTIQSTQAQLASIQPVSGPLPSGVTVNDTLETKTSLSFRPNPIGLGQQLLINMWINPAVTSNNRFLPKAFILTITKPDDTKNTMTLDSEPATAAQWLEISPDQLGTWKFKVEFLGTYFPAGRYYNGYIVTNSSGEVLGSAYYKASSTQEQTLTVQQDLIWSWPAAPLPTDYWTRPASINNREWWPILGNYPGTGYVGGGPMWDKLYSNTNVYDTLTRQDASSFIPWVQAPNSAHIVWKRQGAIGGLIGGTTGIYGTLGNPGDVSVIYAGRAYQTYNKPGVGSVAQCYNLRTGEIIYEIPGGVTPQSIAYVQPGALADSSWSVELINIGGGRLLKINPWTGLVTGNYSIAPLTTGTFYRQTDGYALSLQNLGNTSNPKYRLINWTTRGTSSTLAARILNN
ncbi:MAG TPA: hypothetical protein VK209_10030, partial [Candidatus Sulfotelmatobacter sp.]|nr:hypothetical protein [Candidatus Sulfotelmatobacter sp.]